jgi:hypothetical protein
MEEVRIAKKSLKVKLKQLRLLVERKYERIHV